jgi:hypothetical protein
MKAMLKTLGSKTLGSKAFEKMSADSTKTMMIVAMVIHLTVNGIYFGVVNDDKNDKEKKKGCLIAHAIISSVVFGLLMLIKLLGIIPYVGEALKQDIFHAGYSYVGVPFFIHLIASIVTAVLSSVRTDYDPLLLSNIFNAISTFVCILTFIFACHKTEDLDMMAENSKKATATTTDTTAQTDTATATKTAAKEFGKRQRRRNPPKRRKKKKKY